MKRILIVDDEAGITRTMKVNLERTGDYTVRTENVAASALAAGREFQPDLVLLDVMMPGMDGGAVAAQFHEDPLLKHVPIVFLTAIVTRKETGDESMKAGGEIFLAKPVKLDTLIKCIEENTQS